MCERESDRDRVCDTCFGWQGGVSVSRQTSPSTTSTSRTRCQLAEHAGQERRKPKKKSSWGEKKFWCLHWFILVTPKIEKAGRGHIKSYIIYIIYNVCVRRLQLGADNYEINSDFMRQGSLGESGGAVFSCIQRIPPPLQ